MQKIFIIHFLFVLLTLQVLVLLGCTKRKEQEQVAFSLWFQEDKGDKADDFINNLTKRFMKDNPTINIGVVSKDTNALREDFQAASQEGKAPELLWAHNDIALSFILAGVIDPVDDIFDKSKFIDSVKANGKTYGVPISSGGHLMLMYNKRMIALPPSDTNTLIDLAKVLTGDGRYGFVYNQSDPFWLFPWLSGYSGKLFSDGGATSLNTSAMVATLTFLYDLKHTHKVSPQEADYVTMDAMFKEGKAAMIINGDWALRDYISALEDNFGVAPIPKVSATGEHPAPYVSSDYFIISKGVRGKVRAAIKSFIAYVTSEEIQIEILTKLKRLPALRSALNRVGVQENDLRLQSAADQLKRGKTLPAVAELKAVLDVMAAEMQAVLSGEKSPREGAKDMQVAAEIEAQVLEEVSSEDDSKENFLNGDIYFPYKYFSKTE